LHHLLLTGLPAHSALPPRTDLASRTCQVRRVRVNRGASSIEYGLIAAGIAIVAAVQGVGAKLETNFSNISTSLK
jgi:Flp pilus assembly pilin Flp